MSEYLWVEKYRPKKISECILTEDLRNTFTQFIKQGEIPNLLLSGSAGTGKTTVAKAVCEELGCDYIVINGSDEGRERAIGGGTNRTDHGQGRTDHGGETDGDFLTKCEAGHDIFLSVNGIMRRGRRYSEQQDQRWQQPEWQRKRERQKRRRSGSGY